MIEFESVGKTFRDGTPAVVDLSLTLPAEQLTVIVGPAGCGTTTTLRLVNRMLEPTSGRILWDGSPLRSRRRTALRRQMGYVVASGGLFPHRTVVENVGTVPGLLGWKKDKTDKHAMELLGRVGLDRRLAHRYPAQLSGGQEQRVGLARALAADPPVLLLDEPFSAVDPTVRGELHELVRGLQRELGKTVVLATHDIDEAITLGDRVVVLRPGGRLAQVGTPQQLLDEPADAFVDGFIGLDRGYRALAFRPASGLSLERVDVVRDVASADSGRPTLVVDGDARPVGWAHRDQPGRVLPLGSTFVAESDTLRTALDSSLTSPYGLAVAIAPGTGRFAGVAGAEQILAQVARARTATVETVSVARATERGAEESESAPLGAEDGVRGEPEEVEAEERADDVTPPELLEGRTDDERGPDPVEGPGDETRLGPVDEMTADPRPEPVEGPKNETSAGSAGTGSTAFVPAPLAPPPPPPEPPDTRWASGRTERAENPAWASLASHVGGRRSPDEADRRDASDRRAAPTVDEASTDTVVIEREPDRDPTR